MSESKPLSAQRALSAKWRANKPARFGQGYGDWHQGQIDCADELDALPSIPDVRKWAQHLPECRSNICGEMGCMTRRDNHAAASGQWHVFKPLFACTCGLDTALAGGQQ